MESLQAAVKGSSLVICVLDAARVDHFGVYGYPRPTTPSFDRLADDSLLFDQHFAEAPQTRTSTISLFTGQYPDTHQALAIWESGERRRARGATPFTLEKALQGAGFRTFISSSNPLASPQSGVGSDFMAWPHAMDSGVREGWRPDTFISHAMSGEIGRLQSRPGSRLFAYLHVLPPHQPYRAPGDIARLFAGERPPTYWQGEFEFPEAAAGCMTESPPDSWVAWGNSYDANLRWADSAVGALVDRLRASGQLEKTLLIITADHGEALREHGYGFHAGVPYDEALHIPLLIRFPGGKGPHGRVKALTQTIDLLPTLLDLYGVPYPHDQVQGRTMLPLLTGRASKVNDTVVSLATPCYIVRDVHSTLVLFPGGRQQALYDMDRDPWQTRNIAATQPARVRALVHAFEEYARRQKRPPIGFLSPSYRPPKRLDGPADKLSDEARRQLRALGYLK